MPKQSRSFEISVIGGLNENDQANMLVRRSYSSGEYGFGQTSPVESPSLLNIDFDSNGFITRKGSTDDSDLTGVLVTDDVLIKGIEIQNPVNGSDIQVIIGQKSIYTKQSGSFAQMNNSNSSAYTHAFDVTNCTLAYVDGHLFIGLDSGNSIQVYKNGADLDDTLHNSTTTTSVDADSASGQTVLNVASTTEFVVGDRVVIDSDSSGGGIEYGYIASIQAAVSITLEDNLTNTHTSAQADAVAIANLYENVYDTATNLVTGDIGVSFFLLTEMHSRLIYSDGNTLVYYSPTSQTSSSGIFDIAGSTAGSYQSAGRVRALTSVTPYFTDSLDEKLYIGTAQGFEVVTGFGVSDIILRVEGSGVILNHQTFAISQDWLIYLTVDKNIYAINNNRVIDLGRRAKNLSNSGKLDGLSVTQSLNTSFGFYNSKRHQCYFFFTTAASQVNDRCIVVDFKIGEPVFNEPKDSFEKRVRLLNWQIDIPGTNDWFRYMYKISADVLENVIGVQGSGKTYVINSGTSDYGTLFIESFWFTPIFSAETESFSKQWFNLFFRGTSTGEWPAYIDVFLNRDTIPDITFSFSQGGDTSVYGTAAYGTGAYTTNKSIRFNKDASRYSEAIQWKIYNNILNQIFAVSTQGIRYSLGTERR